MTKMTNVGDHLECPQCGRKASVVWISKTGKDSQSDAPDLIVMKRRAPIQRPIHCQTKLKKKAAKRIVFLMKAPKE